MKKFLDMNVCLYKLYKCVHDRVRRFYTSAGQVTYGHGAFSSNSSTLLWETSKERDTRTQLGTKEKETGISPGVEWERDREKERQAPWVSSILTPFACFSHSQCEDILNFILSRRKRIGSRGALSGDSCDDALCPKDAQVVGLWWVLGDPLPRGRFSLGHGFFLHCAGSLASQRVS